MPRVVAIMLTFFFAWTTASAREQLGQADVAPLLGSWTLDASRSGASEAERRVITAGPGWMRVEIHRQGDAHPPTLIYNLDGSTNTNPYGTGTATTELRRDGDALITLTVITINDRPVTVQERLRVTAPGELTAAVMMRVEHGYQGVQPALERRPPNVAETSKHFRKTPD